MDQATEPAQTTVVATKVAPTVMRVSGLVTTCFCSNGQLPHVRRRRHLVLRGPIPGFAAGWNGDRDGRRQHHGPDSGGEERIPARRKVWLPG